MPSSIRVNQSNGQPELLHKSGDENPTPAIRIGDLCCGLGGMSLSARQLGMQVVVGVDVNSASLRTFSKNFPEAEAIHGNIAATKVVRRCTKLLSPSNRTSEKCIVLSGPPCQGFSVAGSRDPGDPRNEVLISVARAVTAIGPDAALIENVSALLTDRHSSQVDKFQAVLADGGYQMASIIVDASDFGLAQKRRRAFFLISHELLDLKDIDIRLESLKRPKMNVSTALRGLPTPAIRPDDYADETEYSGPFNHFAMQHSERVIQKIAGLAPGGGPMSYRKLNPSGLSNTLFSGHRAPPAHFSDARSITVREAARLQGFPDDFRIYGSFGNQMAQVTNAVPPPLTSAVLTVLATLLQLT